MEPRDLTFTEIVNITDDRFLPWLDLYETAFPPAERVLVSTFIHLLKEKSTGEALDQHLLAGLDAQKNLAGMAAYELNPEAGLAFLWYLAIAPNLRSQGIGSFFYQEIVRRVDLAKYPLLLYEVEIPEGEDSATALRRIQFYQRNGAQILSGIYYMQHVGWHQPPIPMHLMVHLRKPLEPQQVFDLAKIAFQDHLQQTSDLKLV